MIKNLTEPQKLELVQVVIDNLYGSTNDEWYKKMSQKLDERLHKIRRKWWLQR